MRNIRIQDKIFLSLCIIALLGGGLALVNLLSARQLATGVSTIGHNLDKMQAIMTAHDHAQAIMESEMRLLSRELSLAEREAQYRILEQAYGLFDKDLRAYDVLVKDKGEAELGTLLSGQWQKWRQEGDEYLKLCRRFDKTDILDPLQFQNDLFLKKEEAYRWLMTLSEAISNEAPFTGALSEKESPLGIWLFGISSENSSLAVAIGKARKPLDNLYHSARKINKLISSARPEVIELLAEVFESETLPAKDELFAALGLMTHEADKASEIYVLMGGKVEELSATFSSINTSFRLLTSKNKDLAARVIADGQHDIAQSNRVTLSAFLGAFAAIFFLAMALGKLITRPLVKLHKAAGAVLESGDYSGAVAVTGSDEIALVGRSLQNMVGQLNLYSQELEMKDGALAKVQEALRQAGDELVRVHALLESGSHSLDESAQARTQELVLHQAEVAELNARLQESNDKLSVEIDKHDAIRAELEESKEVGYTVDKTKSAFLANMSHEIRTPMNAIIGLTSLALKQEVSSKVHDYLSTVKKSARELLAVIDDILDFSKIEAGKLELEEINFNLHDVLDSLSALFGQRAREKQLGFDVNINDDVPLHLIGDPLRLGQVLINLMGNAVKFTQEGQVSITVAVQESNGQEVELLFTVADTGIGIDENQQDVLFDAFSQGDDSISRQYGGTGLGLAISKRIVGRCGGQIWLESVPGNGSAIHFTVRFQRQIQVDLPTRYKEIFAGSRVLVVDDNKMFRHFMSKMLASFCFEVELAEDGESALAKLREMASLNALPHVILLDRIMPGMDGLTLVKILSDEPDFAEIPIVMISVDGQDVTLRRRADEFGVKAVLSKPVKRELLLSCLEMLLKDEAPEDPGLKEVAGSKWGLVGRRILLVEDNAINREVASEILVNAGIEVVTAEDGEEALAKVGEGIDAVLMDVQMPKVNGLEATRRIRQRPEFAEMPIVAMTARAMKGDRKKCLDAGMNTYIAKPIEPETLYRVILDVLTPNDQGESLRLSAEAPHADHDFDLPGIDAKSALRRINNNRILFKKLLGEFAKDNNNVIEDVNSYFQAGEIEKVVHIVHSLKGVAGNLGASALQEAAHVVEKSLRQNGVMSAAQVGSLEVRLREVLDGINEKFDQPVPELIQTDVVPLSPLPEGEEIKKMFTTLLGHIEANTPKAEKYLQNLPRYASNDFEKGRKDVQACLEQFDFEAAKESLVHLAAQVGVQIDGA